MKLKISHIDLDSQSTVIDRVFGIEFDKINYTNYGDENELLYLDELDENSEVWYIDFSPNSEAQRIIMEKGAKCFILDHHIAVKEDIENWMKEYPFVEYVFDNDRSGTKIYYDYVKDKYPKNEVLEQFVELVNTYDLFKKDSPLWKDAENLNRVFFKTLTWYKEGVERFESFIKNQVWKCHNMKEYKFSSWEMEKINKDISEENDIFNSVINGGKETLKTRKDKEGNYFCVIKLKKKISAIASRLLEKYKGLKYVIVINCYKDDDWSVSVRSRDDFDLLQFEYLKGHSNASGCDKSKIDVNEYARKLWEGKEYCIPKKRFI